jgi:mRNA interferase RelE/StbE
MRVGGYRVIYEIDDAARSVIILNVGHRREIYR